MEEYWETVFDRDLETKKDSLERSTVKDCVIIHIEIILEIVRVDPIFMKRLLMDKGEQGSFITEQKAKIYLI